MLKPLEINKEPSTIRNYWLGLFTGTSWRQYLSSNNPEIGFNFKQIKQAQKIKPGDKIIAYLTKVGSFVGILEATDFASVSKEEKWSEGLFPVRVPATPVLQLNTKFYTH